MANFFLHYKAPAGTFAAGMIAARNWDEAERKCQPGQYVIGQQLSERQRAGVARRWAKRSARA
ncbi:hypothetical protein DYU11_20060 [Fibrisoma montanum]|uniref:Uncharacterized protein n=1 Tax=Fibrisoma montanum TaxID=2305895 RepID=A0A418M3K4_9BACT|nr:hypothetical protein [Fibrisoma montanum]RIV20348.1 hypothetical protein DYU11_20060 [Fibrisoma montanum]